MRVPLRTASRQHFILCPFCESGEIVSLGPNFTRCGSCALPLLGSALEILRDIVGLPDALGAYPCECGPRLRRGAPPDELLCFEKFRKVSGTAVGQVYRGMRTVPVGRIGGSVGRCSEFDQGFMPARASVEEKCKRADRAFHRGEALSPVTLYEIRGLYFVLDGHHRVSVAFYHGVEWIDAEVTEFRVRLPKARKRAYIRTTFPKD